MDENKKNINLEDNKDRADSNQSVLACNESRESVPVLLAKRVVALRRMSTLIVAMAVIGSLFMLSRGGFAWLFNNERVGSSGMGIDMEAVRSFNTGVKVTDQHTLTDGTRAETVTPDAIGDIAGLLAGYTDDVTTISGGSGVVCGLSIDPVYNGVEWVTQSSIRPGSGGTVDFRIIPDAGESNSTYNANIVFKGIKKDKETGDLTLIDPANAHIGVGDAEALNFLKGHILLFADRQFDGMRYTYSNPISFENAADSPAITITCPGSHNDYLVTLYWKWPQTYGDLLNLRTDLSSLSDQQIMNKGIYLKGETRGGGYNNADQVIGDNIAYITVEFDFAESGAVVVSSTAITASALAY